MRRVLVLRGGALGDFILTLPTLAALRRHWPEAVIELAGNATAAELALERGLINRVHSQSEARWAALYAPAPLPPPVAAWLAEFDLVVNYWPDPDGTLSARFPVRAGQRFVSAAAMPTRAPAAAHYLAALAPLGIRGDTVFWPLRATRGRTGCAGTTAIHPGSGSVRKNWAASRWLELIAAVDAPILLVAGEAEADAWNEARLLRTPIAHRVRNGSIAVAANLPLADLARRLGECRLFLGHDSGISHLAAACGTPCILLFGPTDPAMWAPPGPHVRVIRRGVDLAGITVAEMRRAMADLTDERGPADRSETASASSTRSGPRNRPRRGASR